MAPNFRNRTRPRFQKRQKGEGNGNGDGSGGGNGGGGKGNGSGSTAPTTPPAQTEPDPFPRQEEATGSGVIVRADGYVLTNDHVVAGSQYATVTLSDGREFRGRVVEDFRSDLALVKIDPGTATLPVAHFADSDTVTSGQWAIAIGSPFDLQNTMTVGVISATHRHQTIGEDASSQRYYPDLIQTDAAINPGNSGGPLLDIDGQVCGINVAIESPVEGSAGVGFAIPAKTAQYVLGQLIDNGKVVRGYLGLAPQDLTPARSEEYGVPSGAWVVQVDHDSPAGKAGIHATDVITRFDGHAVDGELALRTAIETTTPGKTVSLSLVRNGMPMTVSVTVAAPPPSETDSTTSAPSMPKVGVSFKTLTSSDRQQLGLTPDITGVLVTSVAQNSPADLAGLDQGDVIERVGRKPVETAADAGTVLDTLKDGDQTTLVVIRSSSGKTQEIALDLKL